MEELWARPPHTQNQPTQGQTRSRAAGLCVLPTAEPHVHGPGLRGSGSRGQLSRAPWAYCRAVVSPEGPAGLGPCWTKACLLPTLTWRSPMGSSPQRPGPAAVWGAPAPGCGCPRHSGAWGRPTKGASLTAASLPESEHGEPASRSGHSEAAGQAPQCRLGLRPRTLGTPELHPLLTQPLLNTRAHPRARLRPRVCPGPAADAPGEWPADGSSSVPAFQ